MSNQDNQVCEKCGKPCGYDDNKGYYDPGYLCGQCKLNLIRRFRAVFALGGSSDEWGLQVAWRDADRILAKLQRDLSLRIVYYVTEKELYQKRDNIPTSVLLG